MMPPHLLRSTTPLICLIVATSAGHTCAGAPTNKAFTFVADAGIPDATRVEATDRYTDERGFGFDLNTAPTPDGKPFFFSVAVAEGNHRVRVTFGDESKLTDNTVRAESRQLMIEHVATKPGEFVTRSFIVNVRNTHIPPPPKNAPGGVTVVLNEREVGLLRWDDKLTFEFNGQAPGVRSVQVEPVQCPTIFLLGDSTVTDQPSEPAASWGQMLPCFLKPEIAVANHAESGETMKSFLTGLRLAKVLSQIKEGDWAFLQFAHNDEKKQWPQTYVEANTTYRAYLKTYIAEIRLRGATPVLVTSMQRRTFDDEGHIRNSHGDYPQAVRDVAAEEKVALIDLDPMSVSFYEALGPDRAPLAFNNGGRDATHHDNYGAYELAQCVIQGIQDARIPLASFIRDDFSGFDPASPDAPEEFTLPPSPDRREGGALGN